MFDKENNKEAGAQLIYPVSVWTTKFIPKQNYQNLKEQCQNMFLASSQKRATVKTQRGDKLSLDMS